MLASSLIAPFSSAHAQATADSSDAVDAACANAPLLTSSLGQARSLMQRSPVTQGWLRIDVRQGERYRIETTGAPAEVGMEMRSGCTSRSASLPVHSEAMEFVANQDASYYIKLGSTDASAQAFAFSLIDLGAADGKRVPIDSVPLETRRYAQDFLDSMRNSTLAPNWTDAAQLAREVGVFYRPDLTTIAYYDFSVLPEGFIQVSAGKHDYPVTGWDPNGKSNSEELDALGAQEDKTVSRYYKLDSLSYAAEYDVPTPLGVSVTATDVVMLGTLPAKLIGLDEDTPLPLEGDAQIQERIIKPAVAQAQDSETMANTAFVTETLGVQEEPAVLSTEAWNSWSDFKSGFGASYGVLLGMLSDKASSEWQSLADAAKYGELLVKGDERTVRAAPGANASTFNLSGAGMQYITASDVMEGANKVGVKITVNGAPSDATKVETLDLTIQYSSGVSETKKFAIGTLLDKRVLLPLIGGAANNQVAAASEQSANVIHDAWGPWQYWWAGTTGDQRVYDQFQSGVSPNNSGCWSGCGATAWGMLFGWADYRASISGSGWNHRWGIYRVNGGYGANAVAPPSMDQGVRNMMWEIRGYIKTYCGTDGGGWTYASDMGNAWRYLSGRTGATLHDKRETWLFVSRDAVAQFAADAIKGGTPAVIGQNSHFPLAWGYAQQTRQVCGFLCLWKTTEYNRWFWLNMGWSGSGNGWYRADTWYAGTIHAN
jgi:hypothetical protein